MHSRHPSGCERDASNGHERARRRGRRHPGHVGGKGGGGIALPPVVLCMRGGSGVGPGATKEAGDSLRCFVLQYICMGN